MEYNCYLMPAILLIIQNFCLELWPSFESVYGNKVFKQTNIPLSALDQKPWAVMLRRNVRVNSANRNETDMAIYHPDLFLRVNKAEQRGLGI